MTTHPTGFGRFPEPNGRVRLSLRKQEAAAALGLSDESFDRYVKPYVRVVRLGTMRVYPVRELERWLEQQAQAPLEDAA